jgi:excinuclease ABC subunit C
LATCGTSFIVVRAKSRCLNNPLLTTLPHQPGVYLMRDTAGGILYIGKAIDLRKRVANYFRPDVEPKIRALMADVRHIDYIAAAGERDALVMEQRLINRHQPLFNVMWKDGKSYPFVKSDLERRFSAIAVDAAKTAGRGPLFRSLPQRAGGSAPFGLGVAKPTFSFAALRPGHHRWEGVRV